MLQTFNNTLLADASDRASTAETTAKAFESPIAAANARAKAAEAQILSANAASQDAVAKVATAEVRIAEANRGTAEAKVRVAQAEKEVLELQRQIQPRRLNAEKKELVTKFLKDNFKGSIDVFCQYGDSESCMLAKVNC